MRWSGAESSARAHHSATAQHEVATARESLRVVSKPTLRSTHEHPSPDHPRRQGRPLRRLCRRGQARRPGRRGAWRLATGPPWSRASRSPSTTRAGCGTARSSTPHGIAASPSRLASRAARSSRAGWTASSASRWAPSCCCRCRRRPATATAHGPHSRRLDPGVCGGRARREVARRRPDPFSAKRGPGIGCGVAWVSAPGPGKVRRRPRAVVLAWTRRLAGPGRAATASR